MTTEERLRMRQYRLGIVVLILAVITIVGSIVDWRRERTRDLCFERSFADLTVTLTERATNGAASNALKDQKLAITEEQLTNFINLIVISATNPDRTEAERAALLKEFLADTERFKTERSRLNNEIKDLTEEQKDNPVPPYPEGKCD